MQRLVGSRGFATALLLFGLAALVALSVAGAAGVPNVSGSWAVVDHCDSGWCAGKDYTGTWTLVNAPGSSVLSGRDSAGGVLSGTLSGAKGTWTIRNASGYDFDVRATFSSDGTTFRGTFKDSRGAAGTTVGTRPAPPPPKQPSPRAVATVVEVKAAKGAPGAAYVQRGGKGPVKPLGVGDTLEAGDVIGTVDGTVMALEFTIGGRVGVNKNASVLIGEQSVVATSGSKIVRKIGLWVKVAQRTEPLEVQTNGGVTGIKG